MNISKITFALDQPKHIKNTHIVSAWDAAQLAHVQKTSLSLNDLILVCG